MFLFRLIRFTLHQFSIRSIPFYKAILLSASIAISSAKTITITPLIRFKSSTRSFITRLKKKGDDLLPWGQPKLIFIFFLFSRILIEAAESIHFAIRSSFLLSLNNLFSLLIRISWSMLSKAFLRSNRATHVHCFSLFLNYRNPISL